MLDGSDPLFCSSDAKVSAERVLGVVLIAMLVATAILLVA